jgi:hypothetical protein
MRSDRARNDDDDHGDPEWSESAALALEPPTGAHAGLSDPRALVHGAPGPWGHLRGSFRRAHSKQTIERNAARRGGPDATGEVDRTHAPAAIVTGADADERARPVSRWRRT